MSVARTTTEAIERAIAEAQIYGQRSPLHLVAKSKDGVRTWCYYPKLRLWKLE